MSVRRSPNIRLQACLNGDRPPMHGVRVPITADQLARDANAATRAGATSVHLHARDGSGRETLDAGWCDDVVRTVRDACPGIEIGVSTAISIAGDAETTRALVARWRQLPDVASVNLPEPGAVALAHLLAGYGIRAELGVWSVEDVGVVERQGMLDSAARILVEIGPQHEPAAAVERARAISGELDRRCGRTVPRLVHGEGPTAWPVLAWALREGWGVRAGLEDMLALPDGSPAVSNAAVLAAARDLANEMVEER